MGLKDTRRRKSGQRSIECLEDRRVMSAEPLGELSSTLDSEPPALVHHAERDADFWIDPIVERDLDTMLGELEQALASAHGLTGLTQVRNDYGFIGTGQTVAIIDSGIAYDHYALGGGYGNRVVGGWDFTEENDWNFFDDGPAGSHGTHVTGIVGLDRAGSTDDGVAPGVDFVGLRVFNDDGDGYFSWVENALRWVHTHRNSYENPITAVNLSLGTAWNSASIPSWAMLEEEFAQLEADGIFITVSAGNSFTSYNTPGLSYPAASPYVVPVMSVDDGGGLSYFSQRHTRAIAAPGRTIVSTIPDYTGNHNGVNDDFASYSGTSMAAPYVAGASVLLREAMQFVGYTNITQDTIFDHMMATADTFFDTATNQNYKRLNLANAFSTLMPSDDYGSSATTAHNLGTLSGTSAISGLIGTLSDADYFRFTAAATGTVSFTVSTSHGLTPVWTGSGGTGSVGGANGETYTFQVVAGESYTLGLSTGDGIGYFDMTIQAAATVSNSRPVLAPIGNKSVTEGNLLSFTATATDPDVGQRLTYGLHGGPAGATVNYATGAFNWTPSASQGPGTYRMTIWVMDDQTPYLDDWEVFEITVLDSPNHRPVLASIGNRSVAQGSPLRFTATATDPDVGQQLTYGLHGGPAGATVNYATGAFAWTPSASQGPGTYRMTIWVMDDQTPYLDDWETFEITVTEPPSQDVRYFSTTTNGSVTGADNRSVSFTNADILKLAIEHNGWYRYTMQFDGSDVGLTTSAEDIDAFTFLPDGSILVSTVGSFAVSSNYSAPGQGSGHVISGGGEDLLRFTPSTLGDHTTGTWSLYFDGSDVGLTGKSENIDSVSVLADGRILVSTAGSASVPGVGAQDEDVLAFTPSALGATTWGTWAMYFDGSNVGLGSSSEDVDALFVREQAGGNPTLYFSTRGNFAVAGVSGANEDIFEFTPTQLGAGTSGSFGNPVTFRGAYFRLASFDLDGIHLGQPPAAWSNSGATSLAVSEPAPASGNILGDARAFALPAETFSSLRPAIVDSAMHRFHREFMAESRPMEPVSAILKHKLLPAGPSGYVKSDDWRHTEKIDPFADLSMEQSSQVAISFPLIDSVFQDLGSEI